jgi:hypothetical protein
VLEKSTFGGDRISCDHVRALSWLNSALAVNKTD